MKAPLFWLLHWWKFFENFRTSHDLFRGSVSCRRKFPKGKPFHTSINDETILPVMKRISAVIHSYSLCLVAYLLFLLPWWVFSCNLLVSVRLPRGARSNQVRLHWLRFFLVHFFSMLKKNISKVIYSLQCITNGYCVDDGTKASKDPAWNSLKQTISFC